MAFWASRAAKLELEEAELAKKARKASIGKPASAPASPSAVTDSPGKSADGKGGSKSRFPGTVGETHFDFAKRASSILYALDADRSGTISFVEFLACFYPASNLTERVAVSAWCSDADLIRQGKVLREAEMQARAAPPSFCVLLRAND